MSKIKDAADEAKKLVKMFHSVTVVAEALDEVASVENLIAEVNGRLAQAQELEAAEIKKREAIIASANAIVAEAEMEAKRLIEEAKKFASQAHEEARTVHGRVSAMKADITKLADKQDAQIQATKNALDVINETIKVREVELNALNSNIADAKATIEKMLKG